MMLYEPGRVFQLHENTGFSTVGGIGVVQASPVNHQFHYTVAGCSPKQVSRPVSNAAPLLFQYLSRPQCFDTVVYSGIDLS